MQLLFAVGCWGVNHAGQSGTSEGELVVRWDLGSQCAVDGIGCRSVLGKRVLQRREK